MQEGHKLYEKVKIRFMEAQFVRKWLTNSAELRKLIEEVDLAKENNAKVLGIRWNEIEDTPQLGVKEVFEKADKLEPMKRNVLKTVAPIFDPLDIYSQLL